MLDDRLREVVRNKLLDSDGQYLLNAIKELTTIHVIDPRSSTAPQYALWKEAQQELVRNIEYWIQEVKTPIEDLEHDSSLYTTTFFD